MARAGPGRRMSGREGRRAGMAARPEAHPRRGARVGMVLLLGTLLHPSVAPADTPQGTSFTYQGHLTDGGSPANGAYDLRLTLYDAAGAGGVTVGPVLVKEDVAVAQGLFTVLLDFGAAFAGSARWLEVAVRPGASAGAFTVLSPRQELTPAPSALFSQRTPWAGIIDKPPGFADGIDDDSG